jgi:DNA-directed RNA polymerase subunit M
MEFCIECSSRLVPRKVKIGNQMMLMLVCSKCKQSSRKATENAKLNSKTIEHSPKQLIPVIGKETQPDTLPTIRITCLRCGNSKAYAWQVQTKGTDESSTQFLRCTNCGHTFRENT